MNSNRFLFRSAIVLCSLALMGQLPASATEGSAMSLTETAAPAQDTIIFDPPSFTDPPPNIAQFLTEIPPPVSVSCDYANVFLAYAWPANVNMSQETVYNSLLVTPEIAVRPGCSTSSTRFDVDVYADTSRFDGQAWNWGYDSPAIEDAFNSFASVKSTWEPSKKLSPTPKVLAPRTGWWVGLSIEGDLGNPSLIQGEIVSDAEPSFIDDYGNDLCPLGRGGCNWDFKVRVPFGSTVGGEAVFSSSAGFLGQVLDIVEWDLETPGPNNTFDVTVTGTPAVCLAVITCLGDPLTAWERTGAVSAPVVTEVAPGGRSATIKWDAATLDGIPVTSTRSYEVKAYPGGGTCSPQGTALTCTITELTPGDSYQFVVYVRSLFSTNHSQPTEPVAIRDWSPSAPTNMKAVTRGKFTTITWTPPQDSSGIARYQWRVGSTAKTMGKWTSFGSRSTTSLRLTNRSRGSFWIVEVRALWGDALGPSAQVRYRS
jgi:hypothetical protein